MLIASKTTQLLLFRQPLPMQLAGIQFLVLLGRSRPAQAAAKWKESFSLSKTRQLLLSWLA
jgi:hypothetical protein